MRHLTRPTRSRHADGSDLPTNVAREEHGSGDRDDPDDQQIAGWRMVRNQTSKVNAAANSKRLIANGQWLMGRDQESLHGERCFLFPRPRFAAEDRGTWTAGSSKERTQ